MPKITFITFDETQYEVDAKDGATVMETAIKNGVPGDRSRMWWGMLLRNMSRLCGRGMGR